MVSNSLYLTVAIVDLVSFSINMWLIWYVAWGKDWIKTHIHKTNKIKHGTYLEISMWDLGIKTGNFPAINLDEAMSNMGSKVSEILKPNIRSEIIKLLSKDKTQGDIEKILNFIDKQEIKKEK